MESHRNHQSHPFPVGEREKPALTERQRAPGVSGCPWRKEMELQPQHYDYKPLVKISHSSVTSLSLLFLLPPWLFPWTRKLVKGAGSLHLLSYTWEHEIFKGRVVEPLKEGEWHINTPSPLGSQGEAVAVGWAAVQECRYSPGPWGSSAFINPKCNCKHCVHLHGQHWVTRRIAASQN